jgi:hypothetical protein
MKSKLLALLLLAGSSAFAGSRFSFSIGVGGYAPAYYAPAYYPPPPARVVAVPPCPGPGYEWVGGYWSPVGARYAWTAGYWTRRPFVGAYWVAPRYEGRRYYRGYWGRGVVYGSRFRGR